MSIGSLAAKPRWRGRLHGVAFYVSIPQGIALVLAAAGAVATTVAAIYACALSALYGVSAAYHRFDWTPVALRRMRKLDHSMIYVLIAATYTPFGALVLDGVWASVLLGVVWAGAAFGVGVKLVGLERMRVLGGALYIVLGWCAVLAAPMFVGRISSPVLALIVAGGVLYTSGAIVLFRKRPDPSPTIFGYHEIWHVLVVAASLCHYAAVWLVVRS